MKSAARRYGDPLDAKLPGAPRDLPLILIGYWECGPVSDQIELRGKALTADNLQTRRARSDYEPEWPIVSDFVDESWDEAERDRVASYLEQGLVPWEEAGMSLCRFCGAANGSAERTDGVYLWPEGLAHYVRDHGVRPPVSVIRHIVSWQAAAQPPPTEDEAWWKTLHSLEDIDEQTHTLPPGWWTARINQDWWKTAKPDS